MQPCLVKSLHNLPPTVLISTVAYVYSKFSLFPQVMYFIYLDFPAINPTKLALIRTPKILFLSVQMEPYCILPQCSRSCIFLDALAPVTLHCTDLQVSEVLMDVTLPISHLSPGT